MVRNVLEWVIVPVDNALILLIQHPKMNVIIITVNVDLKIMQVVVLMKIVVKII